MRSTRTPRPRRVSRVVLACVVILGLAGAAPMQSQAARGSISGQISDEMGGIIPGAAVAVERGGERWKTTTDSAGRFIVPSLSPGSYRVQVALLGFRTVTGEVTLSPSVPRAHVVWKLEIDCALAEVIIDHVGFPPRDVARMVDFIVHARVTADNGALGWSTHPGCPSRAEIVHTYSIERIARVAHPKFAEQPDMPTELIIHPPVVPLAPGREYVLLFSAGGLTNGNLVLPVVNGRIPADADKDLAGMTVAEALDALTKWARER